MKESTGIARLEAQDTCQFLAGQRILAEAGMGDPGVQPQLPAIQTLIVSRLKALYRLRVVTHSGVANTDEIVE